MIFVAGGIISLYNIIYIAHIFGESIEVAKSGGMMTKKEVEYSFGVSDTWATNYFYTFSSFRQRGRGILDICRMCFTPVFNLSRILMISWFGMFDDYLVSGVYINWTMGFITIFSFLTQPYRDANTNILLIMLCILYFAILIEIYLKAGDSGNKITMFHEAYFTSLHVVQYCLFGGYLFIHLLFMYALK